MLVVGDSLAVGLAPSLERLLGEDMRRTPRAGAPRPRAWRRCARPADRRPTTVIVSLGTNDGPDPTRFTDRIDRVLAALGPDSCVVWTNIYRPARKGPYAALNGALGQEAARVKRLHLVGWDVAVERRAVTLPDGLHPDPAGFAYRARLIARAVRAHCGLTTVGDDVPAPVGDATTGGVAAPG